ncbi:hypothetical protein [Deinococcus humi]|uniref:SsDNA-binding Zn-finger/Zn-ribbon topoisomerase 1 n=1 Tax=Deinococcus humi TaxID=662880 RepID=A0A7W8JZW3_9DEIO|nr:hypothetical protein [Deinococcus humi]MBB5366292.1 ssDNA-binding Zn-finger/Zn-ribbon topoisomerase 1 [Deinococcus humi]GGO41203.1 hypothetical protein GCM10008949_51690 [Deinococcus humi]
MSKKKEKVIGVCPMCGEETDLIQSHIVSRFVIEAMKARGSGRLRHSQNMDKVVQDGPKPYLLCRRCDNRHSGSETKFNTRLYQPLLDGEPGPIDYDDWLKTFVIFTTYKSLLHQRQSGLLTIEGIDPFLPAIDTAIETFRASLSGERADPGRYRHYITVIPINIDSAEDDVPDLALQALGGHTTSEVLITDADEDEPATCFHYVVMPQCIFWTYIEPQAMPIPGNYAGVLPEEIHDSGTLLLNQPRLVGIHGGIASRLKYNLQQIRSANLKTKTLEAMQRTAENLPEDFASTPVARFRRLAEKVDAQRRRKK